MDAFTGKALSGLAHIRQSLADILTTPVGSRIARRDYGSNLPELIDQPMNATGLVRLYAATALAVLRWEPRVTLTRIAVSPIAPGRFDLVLDAVRNDAPGNPTVTLSIPL